MPDDEIRKIEAVMGAFAKITAGDEPETGLGDARCPRCGKANFAPASSLYYEVVARLEERPEDGDVPRLAGLSDRELASRLAPPRRASAAPRVLLVALPLAGIAAFVYVRVGQAIAQFVIAAAIVITLVVLMTTIRRLSDEYYDRRTRWNHLFICRECGQLVANR